MPPFDPVAAALAAFPSPPGGAIDLTLTRLEAVLQRLGAPQRALPPVVHVAGTNGKGSTLAFLRAMLEAGGQRVHAYTSPQLRFWHETIRLATGPGASGFIADQQLLDLLATVAMAAGPTPLSAFERVTAAAFLACARIPADVVLLETGLGGSGDATNLVPRAAVTAITRLSWDHCEFLGDDLAGIARAKAGILRPGAPVALFPQPEPVATATLAQCVAAVGACPLPWKLQERGAGDAPLYVSPHRTLPLPPLPLPGRHQWLNAGLALTVLDALPGPRFDDETVRRGLGAADWPGRLQRLAAGPLPARLPPGSILWLDGGHNDSAGEVLADWLATPGAPAALVWGMLQRKQPLAFLGPLVPHLHRLVAIPISGAACWPAETLAALAREAGVPAALAAPGLVAALDVLAREGQGLRVVVAGSLALVGPVLEMARGSV